MKTFSVSFVAALFVFLLFMGCAHMQKGYSSTMQDCADNIASDLSRRLDKPHRGVNIIVASPVDAYGLRAGRFGMSMQELLVGAMAERDMHVFDVELLQEPYITSANGLVCLSRDAKNLKTKYKARAIVVTTYIVKKRDVVIMSRVVDSKTKRVIASATADLYKSTSVADLLKSNSEVRLYEN